MVKRQSRTLTLAVGLCLVAGGGRLGFAAPEGNEPGQALLTAVQNEDHSAVATLLRQKTDVNTREEDGATPLAWAALRSNRVITALLLKAGANPNLANEHGIGPLYLAIGNGAIDVAKLL